jgi:3-oxoacyl-[acyl-carrier protein] reductase
VARQVAHANVTINGLLPGSFDTARGTAIDRKRAGDAGTSLEQARADRIASVPARRLGTPQEFGAVCAFLCSAQAGYITGQNLLVDGGAFPGVL